MDFSSDNSYGVAPEILAAIEAANVGTASSYGNDAMTKRLNKTFSDVFERAVEVFPVFTGTAANGIALACATPSWGAVFCHPESHINVDECGAPEFFSGGKLIGIAGDNGKIDPVLLERTHEECLGRGVHGVQPSCISVTQATEAGTVYSLNELATISEIAKRRGLHLHMDGARFANAVVSLKCSPAEASWKAGVDILSFGATKNGALAAEAIVVFKPELTVGLELRRKRAGQLSSKMRFTSAQLLAYVENGLWLKLASRANENAKRLSDGLNALDVAPIYAVEANEIFAWLPKATVKSLNGLGARLVPWTDLPKDGKQLIRFVTSFATPPEAIDTFLAELKKLPRR